MTYTVRVQANDFRAENLTIENAAGPVGQAVALQVEADRCAFVDCRFLGNQDTLYLAGEDNRQYFHDCYIEGTTDFIFGGATAFFDRCEIRSKADSYITAASTPRGVKHGFVFNECRLTAEPGVTAVYLGRPWRTGAKTVLVNCHLGAHIRPEGWHDWGNEQAQSLSFYAELQCVGPGASSEGRVAWSHQLPASAESEYSASGVLRGWIP